MTSIIRSRHLPRIRINLAQFLCCAAVCMVAPVAMAHKRSKSQPASKPAGSFVIREDRRWKAVPTMLPIYDITALVDNPVSFWLRTMQPIGHALQVGIAVNGIGIDFAFETEIFLERIGTD